MHAPVLTFHTLIFLFLLHTSTSSLVHLFFSIISYSVDFPEFSSFLLQTQIFVREFLVVLRGLRFFNFHYLFVKEKLRDVEKKAEMQVLKHEEIMLELELIRTRRDRLMPLCPNCSSQTMAVYQPLQSQQASQHYGSQCPSPQQPIYQSMFFDIMTCNIVRH